MGSFKAEKPAEHFYTLTMGMSLSDWIALANQLRNGKSYASWPGSNFVREIDEMVRQAERVYTASLPPPEDK